MRQEHTVPHKKRRYRPYHRLKINLTNHRRAWTKAECARLIWLADEWHRQPRMTERLAERFGRSPKAIRDMLRKLDWRNGSTGGRTLRQVAALLAIDEGSLLALVRKGRFVPGLAYHARPAAYRIQDDELWDWMTDMRSWHLWEPCRLREPVWRVHFAELRRDWLTTQQAADILCVCPARVLDMRRLGHLPGSKPTPRAVWFRRADVFAVRQRHLIGGSYVFVDRRAPSAALADVSYSFIPPAAFAANASTAGAPAFQEAVA